MRRTLLGLMITASALATGLVAADPAVAGLSTSLMLTVQPSEGGRRSVWLTCRPAAGSHPRPGAACATMARSGGDPAAIPDQDGACIALYAPVTAKASGRWRGRPVRYHEEFGNSCVMRLATGALFRF